MERKNQQYSIPETLVTSKIYIIRNKKIMLDRDLTELYEVETKVLTRQLRGILKGSLKNSCFN